MERRSYKSEIRAAGEDSRRIEGTAALFNVESRKFHTYDGFFTEVITRNFFDDVLTDDVVAMWDHESTMPLAGVRNGSLELDVTDQGVRYAFEASEASYAQDLLINVRSGLVDQSSFGFVLEPGDAGQYWERSNDESHWVRYLVKAIEWRDVSPVTHAAYPATDVQARSAFDKFLEERSSKLYHGLGRFDLRVRQIQLEINT